MKRWALPLLLALCVAPGLEAGPWPVGKGHVYGKLGYQRLRAQQYLAPDGTAFSIPTHAQDDLDLFVLYGVSEGLSVFGTLPVVRSSDLADQPDELRRSTGFGDLRLGLQRQLGRQGPWVLAASGLVQVPSGDETRSGGLQATGSGAWEGEAGLSAGRSWSGGRWFGFAEVGYDLRGSGLRDGFLYSAQVGWNARPSLVLIAYARGLEPFSHQAGARTPASFVGAGDRVTYLVYGGSVIVKLSRGFGLQVDLEQAGRRRNLVDGIAIRIAPFFHR